MDSHSPKSQDATTQCPCSVLHEGCNLATCHKAASRKEPARETSQTESLGSQWAVECTLSALRSSALQGCSTCGIYYAGLSMPGFFAHMANEDHVRVKIKDNGAYVVAFNSVDDYFYGELEFFTTMESDFRSSCQLFSMPKLYSSTSSEESFQDIADWMKDCQTHPGCQSSGFSVLPTRVLDVGSDDESNPVPYLLEPGDLKGEYVTLSHCWGDRHIVTTTKESLPRRKDGIEVSLLPKTFVDAIMITRKLKFRYLWIDSLCIIQDDEADWELESKEMAKIYKNSALTISASAAPNGEYGCFSQTRTLGGLSSWAITAIHNLEREDEESESSVLQHFNVDRTPIKDDNQLRIREYYGHSKETRFSDWRGGNIVAIYSLSLDNHIHLRLLPNDFSQEENIPSHLSAKLSLSSGVFVRKHLKHSEFYADLFISMGGMPLFQRAWAFQERLLSSRVLHYTESELVWECYTTSKCQCGRILSQMDEENFPELPSTDTDRALKPTFAYSFLRNLTSEGLRDLWENFIFHYSRRKLSHDTDRLPALSGLAQRFQTRTLGKYAAGLWEKHLHTQILWRPRTAGTKIRTRSSKYIAPTWSWASLSCGIYFIGSRGHKSVQIGNDILRRTKIIGSILEVHCMPSGLDPLGSIVGGYLRVRGQMIQATLSTRANPERRRKVLEWSIDDSSLGSPQPYLFDVVNDNDGSSLPFDPDSTSDIDVLTPRQSVFCLLWSLPPDTEPPLSDENDFLITILVLRQSQRQPGNYERIGLMFLKGDGSKKNNTEAKNESPAVYVSKWFHSPETVDITIL